MSRHRVGCDWLGSDDAPLLRRLPLRDELGGIHADITRDLPDEGGRYIAPGVKRHGRESTVWVSELLVGTALTNLPKPRCSRMVTTTRGGSGGILGTLTRPGCCECR